MFRILMVLCASAVIATIGSLLPISRALACSCALPSEGDSFAKRADYVFEGVAVAKTSEGIGIFQSTADPVRFTFRVETQVKGQLPDQVVVATAAEGPSCGAGFQVGERWRVFARSDGKDVASNLCSGNRLLDEAAQVTQPPADGAQRADPATPVLFGLGFVGLLALVALLLFGVRPTSG